MLRNIIGPLLNFNLGHFLTLEFWLFVFFFWGGGGETPIFIVFSAKHKKKKRHYLWTHLC